MLIFNITFPKGLMTCVPDSLIRKLNTSEFQVIGLNRKPDAQDFIQALQEYNTKTENVTCQGVELKEQELKENMESIENIDLNQIGSEIENHKFFPNKTNVEFIEIINSKKIKMKVWERGVGITLACGSGACAAVYAGWKKNLIENNAEVQLETGSLHIKIIDKEAIMTGPAEVSYNGYIQI